MHARIVTLQGDPSKIDEGIQFYKDQALPPLRQQRGFKGARLLVDRRSGKVEAVSLWESEEAANGSAPATAQARTQGAQILGSTPATMEVFEIAVYEDA